MDIGVLIALAAVLAYGCFQQAGVVPREWNPCVAAIGLIAAVHFLMPRRERVPTPDRLLTISAVAVLGIAGFQLVPLPLWLVQFLSPMRMELLRATAPLAGLPRFVTLSAEPYATAQAVLSLAAYVVTFFLVRDLTARLQHRPWATLWPLIVVCGLEATLGFYQAYGDTAAQATGTYNSRDHFGGLLEMALPLAAMYAVAIIQRSRRPHGIPAIPALQASGMMAASAVMIIAIVFSLSRMAFFCALAALLISGCLALSVRGWRVDRGGAPPFWRRALPFGVVTVGLAAGAVLLPSAPLIARFSDLAHTDDITADTRAQLWRDTVPLIKDYPLFGCGFGAYESCFLRYKTVAPMNTADFAHNDFVQALAELGVLGFAAGMAFAAGALIAAGRRMLYAQSVDERYLAIACIAAMSAMLLHSLVDFNMYVPTNAMVFAWIAGVAGAAVHTAEDGEEEAAAQTA